MEPYDPNDLIRALDRQTTAIARPKSNEDVWLDAYCAAMTCDNVGPTTASEIADKALEQFKTGFRK